MDLISVKKQVGIPKYKQIVQSIEDGIVRGLIKKGDTLPSVNHIRDQFSLSRDTVLTAYNELKARGIVESIVGKGYYVKSEDIQVKQKIFLLFDELNAFKEDLYNSFINEFDENIQVDIYFHHFNEDMFRKLVYDNIGNYHYYVIMPANLQHTLSVVEKLPADKVYILDQTNEELSQYPSIYQNFEKDIFTSLNSAQNLINKYEKVVLLFPDKKQPIGMLNGFQNYRKHSKFEYEVINSLKNRKLKRGEVYLILDDHSLILFIKKMKESQLVLGQDIGVISYNDTLLKEIVEGGITTISTDFNAMGKRLAEMILKKEYLQIENPNSLIIRNSL